MGFLFPLPREWRVPIDPFVCPLLPFTLLLFFFPIWKNCSFRCAVLPGHFTRRQRPPVPIPDLFRCLAWASAAFPASPIRATRLTVSMPLGFVPVCPYFIRYCMPPPSLFPCFPLLLSLRFIVIFAFLSPFALLPCWKQNSFQGG